LIPLFELLLPFTEPAGDATCCSFLRFLIVLPEAIVVFATVVGVEAIIKRKFYQIRVF
jgi:hypothetical protein